MPSFSFGSYYFSLKIYKSCKIWYGLGHAIIRLLIPLSGHSLYFGVEQSQSEYGASRVIENVCNKSCGIWVIPTGESTLDLILYTNQSIDDLVT